MCVLPVYLCFLFVCLLARTKALQNLDPTVRGHTAILFASGEAVMVCGKVEPLRLVSTSF